MTRKKIFAIASMLCASVTAMAETGAAEASNMLYIAPATIQAGATGQLSVCMKNSEDVQSLGLHFQLPEGISVPDDSDGLIIKTSDKRTTAAQHTVFSNYLPEQKEYRVGILQNDGRPFSGTDGEVFTITVAVSEDIAPGDYALRMSDIELSGMPQAWHEVAGTVSRGLECEGMITVTAPTGISDADSALQKDEDIRIVTAGGVVTNSLQPGLNIIKKASGKVVKVMK
ncbi:MAG: hypothetical protein Q4E63_02685 [Prevotellaceae bacterium]|nr:hypothetical protein [Prevotellaceae bacterium]MDO4931551.1 hypothetical protein [Prevotellaceae bacterium]